MRVFWLIMTAAAIAWAVASASSPVSDVSMSCSKIGEFDAGRSVQCTDPIGDVFGVWRLVLVALLLAVAPLAAALSTRRSVWWGAVITLGAVGVAGVVMWTSFWVLLVVGLALAAVGSVAIVVDSVVRASKRTVPSKPMR